jgi:hypothetical protein
MFSNWVFILRGFFLFPQFVFVKIWKKSFAICTFLYILRRSYQSRIHQEFSRFYIPRGKSVQFLLEFHAIELISVQIKDQHRLQLVKSTSKWRWEPSVEWSRRQQSVPILDPRALLLSYHHSARGRDYFLSHQTTNGMAPWAALGRQYEIRSIYNASSSLIIIIAAISRLGIKNTKTHQT